MKTYRVNFDYEKTLFKQKKGPSSKNIAEFEYVFFFINKSPCKLLVHKEYDDDYLEYLKNLELTLPELVKKAHNAENWWGNLKNIELESKLNSKLWTTDLAIKYDLAHPKTQIIDSLKDLKSIVLLNSYNYWLLKTPYEMSGRGHLKISKESVLDEMLQDKVNKKLEGGSCILEPWLDRLSDWGVLYESGHLTFIRNFNSAQGEFKGGEIISDVDTFLGDKKDEYLSDVNKIKDKVKEIGDTDYFQLDSFSYFEGGEVKIYPLVEINYRLTMGHMIRALTSFKPAQGHGMWVIFSSKNMKESSTFTEHCQALGDLLYIKKDKRGVLPISDHKGLFKSFYFCHDSKDECMDLLHKFQKLQSAYRNKIMK